MTNEKQKIKLEDSNVLFFLIHQRENVSVLEKVSKSALSSFVLMIFFFFFLPTSFIFSLYLETEKREGGLEEAAPRAPLSPRLLSGRVHLVATLR